MYLKFKPGDKVLFGKEVGVIDSVNITRTETYYGVQLKDDIVPTIESYLSEYHEEPENIIRETKIEIGVSTFCPYCNHYQDHYKDLDINVFEHVGEIFDVKCDVCNSSYKIKLVKDDEILSNLL